MIALLLLLSSAVMGQTANSPQSATQETPVSQVSGQVSQRTDYLESQIGQLLSGRPTITGVPSFVSGISTGGPAGIPMLVNSTDTVSGAKKFVGGVDFELTTGTGTVFRTAYSSGTSTSFSFVIQGNTRYRLFLHEEGTGGSSTAEGTFICTVNGDSTAGDYYTIEWAYPNAYVLNQQGSAANLKIGSCGTGQLSAAHMDVAIDIGATSTGEFIMGGTVTHWCAASSQLQTEPGGWRYIKSASAPWTVTCQTPSGLTWNYEAILYQVGK